MHAYIQWVTHKRKDSKLLQEELTTTKWSNEYGEIILIEVPRWEMQHLSGKFGTYEEVERPVLAKKNEQNWIKGILMIKGQSERGKKSKDMI